MKVHRVIGLAVVRPVRPTVPAIELADKRRIADGLKGKGYGVPFNAKETRKH